MGLDLLSDVLVVGGSAEDGRVLKRIGFTGVTLSNLLDPRPSEQADLDDAENAHGEGGCGSDRVGR